MIFLDKERSDHVSVAVCDNLQTREWHIKDLTEDSVYMWGPNNGFLTYVLDSLVALPGRCAESAGIILKLR